MSGHGRANPRDRSVVLTGSPDDAAELDPTDHLVGLVPTDAGGGELPDIVDHGRPAERVGLALLGDWYADYGGRQEETSAVERSESATSAMQTSTLWLRHKIP